MMHANWSMNRLLSSKGSSSDGLKKLIGHTSMYLQLPDARLDLSNKWKCLHRATFFCSRNVSQTIPTYSEGDIGLLSSLLMLKSGAPFEAMLRKASLWYFDSLEVKKIVQKRKILWWILKFITFKSKFQNRSNSDLTVPPQEISWLTAIVKPKDDGVRFHSTKSWESDQMAHSFTHSPCHRQFHKCLNLITTTRYINSSFFNPHRLTLRWSMRASQCSVSSRATSASLSSSEPIFTWPRTYKPDFFRSLTKSISGQADLGLPTSRSICGLQNLTCALRESNSNRYFRTLQ